MTHFSRFLIEGRVDDFKKLLKGVYNDEYLQQLVDKDTSKNHKNLLWIGKILKSERDVIDSDELFKNLELFNKIGTATDLYKFKDYMEFITFLSGKNKEVAGSRMNLIKKDSKTIANTKRWLVVVPRSHGASRYFGGGTKWCISTSNEHHWTDYYHGNTIIMIKDRQKSPDDVLFKVALVGRSEGSFDSSKWSPVEDKIRDLVTYIDFWKADDHRMTKPEARDYVSHLPEDLVDNILDYIEDDDVTERQYELWTKNAEEKFNTGNGLRELLQELFDATERTVEIESKNLDYDEFYQKMHVKFEEEGSNFDEFLRELWSACMYEQGVESDEFTPSISSTNLSRLITHTSTKYDDYVDMATEVFLEDEDAMSMDEIIQQSLIQYSTPGDRNNPYNVIVRMYDNGTIPNTSYLKTLKQSLDMYNAKYNPNWFQGQQSLRLGNQFAGMMNKFVPRNIEDIVKVLSINPQAKEMVDIIQKFRKDLYEIKKSFRYRDFFK